MIFHHRGGMKMSKHTWAVDVAHSSIDFSVKHMMVSRVKGTFHDFDVVLEADPYDLTTATIELTVDLATVDTRINKRDDHLRSEDFFYIDEYPKAIFKATDIKKTDNDEYDVTGELTIRGTTVTETFSVTFEGEATDPEGKEIVGFSGDGQINRADYGLTYNAALESGGVVVGDNIKISFEFEAAKVE